MAAELKPSSFPPILHIAARRICPLTKCSPAHTHIRTYALLGAPKANLLILPFRAPKSDGRRTPLRHLAGAHVPWAFLPCRAGFRGFLCPACPPLLPFPAPHLPLGHRVPIGHSESCPFVQFTLSRTHSLPADFCLNCLLTLQIPLVTKNKSGQRHQERLCSEEPIWGAILPETWFPKPYAISTRGPPTHPRGKTSPISVHTALRVYVTYLTVFQVLHTLAFYLLKEFRSSH